MPWLWVIDNNKSLHEIAECSPFCEATWDLYGMGVPPPLTFILTLYITHHCLSSSPPTDDDRPYFYCLFGITDPEMVEMPFWMLCGDDQVLSSIIFRGVSSVQIMPVVVSCMYHNNESQMYFALRLPAIYSAILHLHWLWFTWPGIINHGTRGGWDIYKERILEKCYIKWEGNLKLLITKPPRVEDGLLAFMNMDN